MKPSVPTSCEACLIPFSKDPNADKRENPKYCSYCYSGGKLHAKDATLEEFQEKCYESMRRNGTPWIIAKVFAWSIRFAPYWKERRKESSYSIKDILFTIILFSWIILFFLGWFISFSMIVVWLILIWIFTLFNDEEKNYKLWKQKYFK